MLTYTFVLPIYNTEKYLEECVKSILNQTYSNFKVLLVDDGSTDNSWEICKQLSLLDTRIEIKQVENGGPSRIRNIGIQECNTDYIWFVDSDDKLIDNDILLKINKKLEENNSDIIFFLSAKYDEDLSKCLSEQATYLFDGAYEKTGEELFVDLKTQENIMSVGTSPINKVIKREVVQKNQAFFVEKFRWGEEDEFLSKTIFYSSSFYFFNEVGYIVRMHANSLSSTVSQDVLEKKIVMNFELVDICCKFFEEKSKTTELKKTMFTYFSYYFLFGLKKYFSLTDKKKRKIIKQEVQTHPFIFSAMKQSRAKNIRILSNIYKLFGWEIMMLCFKLRYNR